MALWAAAQVGHALVSWHFIATGAALLGSDDTGAGLHLYATHPQLQIGPLTFLAAAPLNGLPAWLSGSVAAVVIAATAPAMLLSLSHLPHLTVTSRQRGLAAAVLLPVWAELAVHYTHLDDALALVLLIAGMHAVARCRPIPAALLLAESADAKPWALAFVPLLLVLPRDRWHRAVPVWLVAVAAAWLPFVLADSLTLHAGGFSIPNVASSSLRAMGVTAASTPSWDRPVQLLLGIALGAVAVHRGRWLVVPAVVLATRMLLDPGAYPYYTAGLVLATVIMDLGWLPDPLAMGQHGGRSRAVCHTQHRAFHPHQRNPRLVARGDPAGCAGGRPWSRLARTPRSRLAPKPICCLLGHPAEREP